VTGRAAALVSGFLVVISLAACSRSPSSDLPPGIRVGYAGETDFTDLPSLAAHDRLRARGVRVEVTHYSTPDLAIEAAARGSADVVHGSMIGGWRAATRGARIRTVMNHIGNPYRLVEAAGQDGCAGLVGRRLGLASEGAVSTFLVRAFLADACGAAAPTSVFLMESSNRAAALLAGGVDATVLDLSAILWIDRQAPGRFRVLSDFSTRWPDVSTEGVHVNTDFSAAHPDLVRAYVEALLDANHEARTSPERLVPGAIARLGPSDEWAALARAYWDADVWPGEGGLTAAVAEQTLSFFMRHGGLPPGTRPDQVVDRRFLEAAGEMRSNTEP
jgi:ABC-type nitrate/sulfonate/bicarbonate transport system substrate-binding protein